MKTPSPQGGILNRPPEHLVVAAYSLTVGEPTAALAAVDRLRELIRRELRSDLDDTSPASAKDAPSAETGELGFVDGYDRAHLTITVGFAQSGYDKLGVAREVQPQDLVPIPWSHLSDEPSITSNPNGTTENGDVVVQVCADSFYIVEHVHRRISEELGEVLSPVWSVAGHQRYSSRAGRTNREEGRALIGFIDGTSNLDPRREPDDAKLVFVDPDAVPSYPAQVPPLTPGEPSPYGGSVLPQFPADLRIPPTHEPKWTAGGTYMVVRASTFDAAGWDRRPLGEQERMVGRFKVSGQPLDQTDDPAQAIAEPNFAADPAGSITPHHSHVRKTNPRGPDDAARRIFRRGYPLIAGPGAGGLRRGLVFICFGRTITTQFEFITRAWTANPDFPHPGAGVDALRAIDQVLCGGYFFVPALEKKNQAWSFLMPS